MTKLEFHGSSAPTVGIEIELSLVDGKTMELSNCIGDVLQRIPGGPDEQFKVELMQCQLEVITGICQTVGEAEDDLREKLIRVERATDELGLHLFWAGAHPFSSWQTQKVTPNERYENLVGLLQEMARRLVTCGLHVHVGTDSGDKAVMICDRILQHLPMLLALSCSSPFWENRVTGLASFRTKLLEGLPTAGMPPLMRNWSEYVWLVNHMVDTGFINTVRELWWDVRPHHKFGTVEVRVCDMPGSLNDVIAIAALTQCLVVALSEEIDEGTYQYDCHPMLVQQNKWRACRFGTGARLVNPYTHKVQSLGQIIGTLIEKLLPIAERLGCAGELLRNQKIADGPSWADRQLRILEATGDCTEIVRQLARGSRLSAPLEGNPASSGAPSQRSTAPLFPRDASRP
jgi:carboxylate-amine ligase